MQQPRRRSTRRSINKRLSICNCERRLFISGMFIGFGMFVTLGSIWAGLVTFCCFYILGYFDNKDPVMLRAMLNSGKFKSHYDPAMRKPFSVVIL